MTQHDFDHIDQLLHGEKQGGANDHLYIELIGAAPQPNDVFINSLGDRLNQTSQEKHTLYIPKVIRHIATGAAICILVVSAVYAIDYLLSQVLDSDAGLSAVREDGKGTELELSAIIEQFAVEIQWGYVDTQRISLGYVINAQDMQVYTNIEILDPVLTFADGSEIPLQSPGIHLIENNQTAGRLEANIENVTLPDIINADLSFRLAYAHEAHRTAVPLPLSGTSTTPLQDWMLQTPLIAFELSLPVERGYTIPLNFVAEDAGIEMTLHEFEVAPSSGRAVICFMPPQRPEEEMWQWDVLDVTLEYNEEKFVERATGRNINGCSEVRFMEGLPSTPGTWTLIIGTVYGTRTRLPDGPEWLATLTAAGGTFNQVEGGGALTLPEGADETAGLRERINGEWIFTFDAP